MLLLALSALLFQRSATATWAEARATDGRNLRVSPIGVVDSGVGSVGKAPTECRWWPRLGNEQLCAVDAGAADAMSSLRRVYPSVVIAMWVAVLAIFINALRIPHVSPALGVLVAAGPVILALMAMTGMFTAAPQALSALAGTSMKPAGAGFGSVLAAWIASAAAVVLLIASGRFGRD